MKSLSFRLLSVAALIGLLSGCFVEVIVPAGGTVTWDDGTSSCAANSTCSVEISGADFEETYTAVPAAGYEFLGWVDDQAGEFLCTVNPCPVSNTILAGNAAVLTVIYTNKTYYIMPRFRKTALDTDSDGTQDMFDTDDDNDTVLDVDDSCPLRPTPEQGLPINSLGCPFAPPTGAEVLQDPLDPTREWAQVDLFAGLTWNQINAECSPVCAGAVDLNGYDMSGWAWATNEEIAAVWDNIIEHVNVVETPVCAQNAAQTGDAWTSGTAAWEFLLNDFGFTQTYATPSGSFISGIVGFTSDSVEILGLEFGYSVIVSNTLSGAAQEPCTVSRANRIEKTSVTDGAWFYRSQ
jgi:hypothetical protein